jgi:hypothetical protein
MKYLIGGAFAVVLLLSCYFTALLLIPSNIVASHYPTLATARADRLFERGWLPDILPPSTYGIRTANDLDLNTSEGEFSFDHSEYVSFAKQLLQYQTTHTSLIAEENISSEYL